MRSPGFRVLNAESLRRFCSLHLLLTVLLSAPAVLLFSPHTAADEFPPQRGRRNLALGKQVIFLPKPSYRLTVRGDSDPSDLTDGYTTTRSDRQIWFDPRAVGWSYAGRVSLAVDLEQPAHIDEVAIRLLGGSPQAGVSFPGWIELLVSTDGKRFVRIAECSRWRPGDFERYEVPPEQGKAWIHCLRFTNLHVVARWVGIRMYTGGLTASDELYVFGTPLDREAAKPPAGQPTGFTVRHPQVYFHKPRLLIATNLPLPVPVGIAVPEQSSEPVECEIELPPGVQLAGGSLGDTDLTAARLRAGENTYRVRARATRSSKTFGRLFLHAQGWSDGQEGALRYRFAHGGWRSPWLKLPLRAVRVPEAPRLNRIMVGLGWWHVDESMRWPHVLDVWQHLGINSFPVFARWMRPDHPGWSLVDEARRRGFRIVHIDSPFHHLLRRRRGEREIYDQLPGNQQGSQLCISYRGRYYREEVQLFAEAIARARPDFVALDIELWSWRGPVDARRCLRCQADFKASGLDDWDQWLVRQGNAIWKDLVRSARQALEQRGATPRFEIGGYDFRPGSAYQRVWSVDELYPTWLQSSQVSTYTCLYPYHLALIGDEVLRDRKGLGRNDVLPWITPGDAGTFPGEAFQWALLECFCNGARGIYFWSGRVWDAESLIALSRVVRALAPVEAVITDGQPIGNAARSIGAGRVVGMRRGANLVILVSDYARTTSGEVRVQLQLPRAVELVDLFSGELLGRLPRGDRLITVPLAGARARLLWARPGDGR